MFKTIIENNNIVSSIILFIILFTLIIIIKPKILFNDDNSLREFGIGFKNKTILPLWLVSILLGIISYISILYYITY